MLRVLCLVHQYIPSRSAGAETHIHSMLRVLVARGHRVDVVLSAQAGDPYVLDGVNVWPTVDVKRDAFNWLADADLLVSHLDNTTRATVLGEFNNKPVAVVHHNTFGRCKDALVMPSSRTDLVVVNSQHMADDLQDFFKWIDRLELQPRTVIVRPVADVDEYATEPGDRVTLVNIRRISKADQDGLSKGGELFRRLIEQMPDVDFLGVTGVYGTQQELDGLPNVDVIEHVPHDEMPTKVFGRTRVLLMPSTYESWGRVASEAMCSGIPVIASPTPGLVEQLGEAGTFVAPHDTQGWVNALTELLAEPRWSEMSEKAFKRALELHHLGADDLARWVIAVEECVANDYIRRNAAARTA